VTIGCLVMPKYFRPRGFSPRYSAVDTAYYVSRKARLQRGFYLSPTRQISHTEYRFLSGRGPAKDGGEWVVKITELDDQQILNAQWPEPAQGQEPDNLWQSSSNELVDVTFSFDPSKEFVPLRDYNSAAAGNYELAKSLYGDDNIKFKTVSGGWLTVSLVRHTIVVPGAQPRTLVYNFNHEEAYSGAITYYPSSTVPGAGAEVFTYLSFSTNWRDPCNTRIRDRGLSAVAQPNSEPGVTSFVIGPLSSSSSIRWWAKLANCIYRGPSVNDSPDPPVTGGGGGGGAPPGTVSCAGVKAYSCTCPDFSAEEHPYRVPVNPTHYKYRQWQTGGNWNGMQRSLNFPCKHIVSVAFKTQDWDNIFCWARAAASDFSTKELWEQARQSWRDYRDATRQRRQQEADARRAFREEEIGRRVNERDAIDRVFQGRDLGVPPPPNRALIDGFNPHWEADYAWETDAAEKQAAWHAEQQARRRSWDPNNSGDGRRGTYRGSDPREQLNYLNNTLNKLGDMGRFIANEGSRYGWGGNVSGQDPYVTYGDAAYGLADSVPAGLVPSRSRRSVPEPIEPPSRPISTSTDFNNPFNPEIE